MAGQSIEPACTDEAASVPAMAMATQRCTNEQMSMTRRKGNRNRGADPTGQWGAPRPGAGARVGSWRAATGHRAASSRSPSGAARGVGNLSASRRA